MDGSTFSVGAARQAEAGSRLGAGATTHHSRVAGAAAPPPLSTGVGLAALEAWLLDLRELGVRQAAPALVLALERLRCAKLASEPRIAMLRLFKPVVLKTCKVLPKPWRVDSIPSGVSQRGPTLEQRLYRLVCQNLQLALMEYDCAYPVCTEPRAEPRRWLLRNLFRFCARQLRYAALWSCPLPADTWRDLHALHIYLKLRRGTWSVEAAADQRESGDSACEYKALLLFGLVAETAPSAARCAAVTVGLSGWAAQTILDDTRGLAGERGLYVVEVAGDAPPRWCGGPLRADCRGWVLLPPRAFLKHLESEPPAPPGGWAPRPAAALQELPNVG